MQARPAFFAHGVGTRSGAGPRPLPADGPGAGVVCAKLAGTRDRAARWMNPAGDLSRQQAEHQVFLERELRHKHEIRTDRQPRSGRRGQGHTPTVAVAPHEQHRMERSLGAEAEDVHERREGDEAPPLFTRAIVSSPLSRLSLSPPTGVSACTFSLGSRDSSPPIDGTLRHLTARSTIISRPIRAYSSHLLFYFLSGSQTVIHNNHKLLRRQARLIHKFFRSRYIRFF